MYRSLDRFEDIYSEIKGTLRVNQTLPLEGNDVEVTVSGPYTLVVSDYSGPPPEDIEEVMETVPSRASAVARPEPEPQAPRPPPRQPAASHPPPPRPAIPQGVQWTIDKYLDWQEDNDVGRVLSLYDDYVTYNGERLSRAAVGRDKAAYYARWPQRDHRRTRQNITSSKDQWGQPVYAVRLGFAYTLRNGDRQRRGDTAVRLTMRPNDSGTAYLITAEAPE